MQTKHTPGPWILMPDGLAVSGNDPEGTRFQELARMVDGNSVHEHLRITPQAMRANAQLVTAAPAMLDALHLAENTLSALGGCTQAERRACLEVIRAALEVAQPDEFRPPYYWESIANDYYKAKAWEKAAAAYERASAASIGHSRAERYEGSARECRAKVKK